jgi:hypothetical protein
MLSGMTHEQYVALVRAQVSTVALEMLDGKIPFIEGAIKLSLLRYEAEVGNEDKDFMVFVTIASETDNLPIGESKKLWSVEAIERHKLDIEKATEWAKRFGIPACNSLIQRFSA